MQTIVKVARGLDVLGKYSNNIAIHGREIVAGPHMEGRIKEQHVKELIDMGWLFEEGTGWSFWC